MTFPELTTITQSDIDTKKHGLYDMATDMRALTGRGRFFQVIEPGIKWDFLLVTPLNLGRPNPVSAHRFTFNEQSYDEQRRQYSLTINDYLLLSRKVFPVVWMATGAEVVRTSSEAAYKNPTFHSAPLVHPYTEEGSFEVISEAGYEQRFFEMAMTDPEQRSYSDFEELACIDSLSQALHRFAGVPGQDVRQLYDRTLHKPAA